jgi:hypothetical protein
MRGSGSVPKGHGYLQYTEKKDRKLFVFASQKPLIRIYNQVIQILRISIEKQVAVLIGMPWKSTYCTVKNTVPSSRIFATSRKYFFTLVSAAFSTAFSPKL